MSDLPASLKTIINAGLLGLLGAAWFASSNPNYATAVTIAAVTCAIVVAINVPILASKLGKLNDEKQDSLNVEEASSLNEPTNLEFDAGSESWKSMLAKWDDPHSPPSRQQEIMLDAIYKTLEHRLHSARKRTPINIGVVNLIINQESTLIRLREPESRTFERKPAQKIDVTLRPELDKHIHGEFRAN